MPQPQSLDELFRQVENDGLEKARILIAQEAPLVAARLKAQEEARKTIPVWIVNDGEITGPYQNDDAAIKYAEQQGWSLAAGGALIVDSYQEAQQAIQSEPDDDDEEE